MIVSSLQSAFAVEGIYWIIAAAFVAGIVRGFAGFGTAMIFLPIASQYLNPFAAIAALTVMDLVGPLPIVRSAWRDAHQKDLFRLIIGMIVILPFALWLLVQLDPVIFRYLVSGIALFMLIALLFGLRYRGTIRAKWVYLIGGCAGLTGGLTGVPGPPVIIFYMASPHGPSVIRANNLLFLMAFDLAILLYFLMLDRLTLTMVITGIILILPIMVGNLIGTYFFDPQKEKMYRNVAYLVITVSAISGLPFLH